MKKVFFLISLAGALCFLTNCGEDDKGQMDEPLTAEDNKALVQSIGVDFFNEMSALQQTSSVQSLTAFGLLLDDEDDPEAGRVAGSGSLVRMSKSIVGFAKGRITAIEFGHQTYRVNQDDEDDFSSFQDLFDENAGTYDWNAEADSFVYTANLADKIVFNYPSTEDGTSNNASLILSNYTGVVITPNPFETDYTGELPVSLDVELKVDGTTEMTYGFDIDYSSEGVPEGVETKLTLNDYSLSVSLTNTDTKVGASVNLSNGSTTIIGVSTEVDGDFSDEAIEGVQDSEDPTDVVNNGNFSMTLLNLKFSADMQFASFYDAIGGEAFDGSYEEGDDSIPNLDTNADLLEAALNDYLSLTLTYVDTEKTAADVEWYATVESEEDEDGVEHYIAVGARMTFEDGSSADVESFLASGFDELETAINNLIHQIEADTHEDLEDIDFEDL